MINIIRLLWHELNLNSCIKKQPGESRAVSNNQSTKTILTGLTLTGCNHYSKVVGHTYSDLGTSVFEIS